MVTKGAPARLERETNWHRPLLHPNGCASRGIRSQHV